MTLRILFVDHNQNFLTAARTCIGNLQGVSIVGEATNGIEALAMAFALQPDLMLMDVRLPNMGGLDVAKQLQLWPHPPRIVLMHLNDDDAYRQAARTKGMADFFGKADFVEQVIPLIEQMVAATSTAPKHRIM